jgi:NADH:ubiquinone oxidoreductase subunit 3 (subunit A)
MVSLNRRLTSQEQFNIISNQPLESGFEKSYGYQYMSVAYLYIAVLFVFFDIEVIVLLLGIIA